MDKLEYFKKLLRNQAILNNVENNSSVVNYMCPLCMKTFTPEEAKKTYRRGRTTKVIRRASHYVDM